MSVPRIFHFIFGLKQQVEPFHLVHYLCLQSCLQVNKPAQVKFHYRHEPWGLLWERIKPHITLCRLGESLPLEDYTYASGNSSSRYRYAHSSDFLRLEILLREGGVYADMDTLFLRSYPDHLYTKSFVMGHETVDPFVKHVHIGGSLCNALFFSEPQSQFLRLWLERMPSAFDGTWSRHSTFLPFELAQERPDLIHVEPTASFFHLDWTRSGVQDIFERDCVLPANAYSMHLWAHLWWDRNRTDVSRFHAGRLNSDYVAYASTTYARYARAFLPHDLISKTRRSWLTESALQSIGDALADGATSVRNRQRRSRFLLV